MPKISDTPPLAAADAGDLIPIVDISTGTTKHITAFGLGALGGGGGGGSSDAADIDIADASNYYLATNVEDALSEVRTLADAALTDVAVPADVTATGTPSASTFLRGDGSWQIPGSGIARVSMTTPDTPQPGDTRWNPDLDPPDLGVVVEGGALDPSELYLANKDMFVSGSNVTVVPNDGLEKITFNSSASGGSGTSGHTHLVATASPYNLSVGGTAAANTTALKACINAAIGANKNVFIPAGTYLVNDGCLTPTLGGYGVGLEIHGEGKYRSVLQMAPQGSESYFYNSGSDGNTLMLATFIGLGFQGGPVSTGAERANIDPNHNGFRLSGQPDQSFKFYRCRFATLNGVFWADGPNNASEVAFDGCKITHIGDYVWRISNLQALNLNSINSDIELVWGDIVRTEGTGGGAVNFTMGSIIVQRDGSNKGACVRPLAQLSSTVTFMGCRIEIRNDAMLFDGSLGSLANVNFISTGTYTTAFSGVVNTVIVDDNQIVNFDKCTFEHNGSHATYTVGGTGWLVFDTCAVRSSLTDEITKTGTGKAKAINCRVRFAQGTEIDFVKS